MVTRKTILLGIGLVILGGLGMGIWLASIGDELRASFRSSEVEDKTSEFHGATFTPSIVSQSPNFLRYENRKEGVYFSYPKEAVLLTNKDYGLNNEPVIILKGPVPESEEAKNDHLFSYCQSACVRVNVTMLQYLYDKGEYIGDFVIDSEKYDKMSFPGSSIIEIKLADGKSTKALVRRGTQSRSPRPYTENANLFFEQMYISDPNDPERSINVQYQIHYDLVQSYTDEFGGGRNAPNIIYEGSPYYEEYRNILKSLVVSFPQQRGEKEKFSSQELGIAFHYPGRWGELIENIRNFKESEQKNFVFLTLNYRSSRWDDPSRVTGISFKPQNKETVGWVWEGPRASGWGYTGQPLESVCEKRGYFYEGDEDIEISECSVRRLSSGVNIAELKGRRIRSRYDYCFGFRDTKYDFGAFFSRAHAAHPEPYYDLNGNYICSGNLSEEEREIRSFHVAMFQTRSKNWPGMVIEVNNPPIGPIDSYLNQFPESESEFNELVESISYL